MKIVIVLALLLSMCGCGVKGLTPLDVTYEVGSLKEYTQAVTDSKIVRGLSDFRLMEMGITEVNYCNFYDYVIVQGVEEIDYAKVINAKALTDIVTLSKEDTEGLYTAIAEGKNIKIEENGFVIPALPELVAQANSVKMQDIFISSILNELGV